MCVCVYACVPSAAVRAAAKDLRTGENPCFKSRGKEGLVLELASVVSMGVESVEDLVTAPDIFWSMILFFHQTGHPLPLPTRAERSSIEGWIKMRKWRKLNQVWGDKFRSRLANTMPATRRAAQAVRPRQRGKRRTSSYSKPQPNPLLKLERQRQNLMLMEVVSQKVKKCMNPHT